MFKQQDYIADCNKTKIWKCTLCLVDMHIIWQSPRVYPSGFFFFVCVCWRRPWDLAFIWGNMVKTHKVMKGDEGQQEVQLVMEMQTQTQKDVVQTQHICSQKKPADLWSWGRCLLSRGRATAGPPGLPWSTTPTLSWPELPAALEKTWRVHKRIQPLYILWTP